MFKIGDKVRAIGATHGWGEVRLGDIGVVVQVNWEILVQFPNASRWHAVSQDLALVSTVKPRRTAKKMVPSDPREQVAVRLIEKVTKGEGKFTAVKVESEGNMQRRDRCTEKCTRRQSSSTPHLNCKFFNDVKVANDFILKELSKVGLAMRCKPGDNMWGYYYKPRLPLVYSKVYTDSETEWTTTLSLKDANDVLYAPFLVDAFNALIEANGNGVNVELSGMHTAFIQGKDGIYPSDTSATQQKMFDNFAKSMRPLLPALYLLGANRIEEGIGVTRSTSPRQPMISSDEKYSAVAYRYGALEFRVFDTCYDNREQLLDNIVVMAQSVSKYWHNKYIKPSVVVDKPTYFGSSNCNGSVNKIESLYVVKDHIVLLNKGLRCIKPPYMTVKEVKQARNFKLTVRTVKNNLDIERSRGEFDRQVKALEVTQVIQAAHDFYSMVSNLQYSPVSDMKKAVRNFRAKADKQAKDRYPSPKIEQIAYKAQFGQSFPLGEN